MSSQPEKPTAVEPTTPATASGALPDNAAPSAPGQDTTYPDVAAPDYDSLYGGSDGRAPEQPHGPPSTASTTAPASTSQEKPPKKSMSSRLASHTPSFMPAPLDREVDKAAAILKAFCKEGVYSAPDDSSAKKSKAIVSIPPRVIQNAVGLAIFTTLRAGFHFSGAMGSGVVIARLPDGSWGPPSGISVLSVGTGFQFGVDVYDCVCVINTREALAAFMDKTRVSLGSDVAVAAGPYGVGGAVDVGASYAERSAQKTAPKEDIAKGEKRPEMKSQESGSGMSMLRPVFSYVKSRGFYVGIQIEGTVIAERRDANAKFYGAPVIGSQILAGNVPGAGPWQASVRGLQDTLVGAQAGVLQSSVNISQPPVVNAPPAASSSTAPGVSAAGATPADAPRDFKYSDIRGDEQPVSNVADLPPPAYTDDGVVRPEVGDQKPHA